MIRSPRLALIVGLPSAFCCRFTKRVMRQIPEGEMWDLVIANPPHFKDQHHGSIRHPASGATGKSIYDPDWIIHQKFYGAIKGHLNSEGVVLIQENFEGSDPMDSVGEPDAGDRHVRFDIG